MGFLYPSICSPSRSVKNILKVLHSNARHSNYEALKFHHTFSMGNLLKRSLMLTHVCDEARRHTPALNTCDSLYFMKEAVVHFATAI